MPPATSPALQSLQRKVWAGSIPLSIRLAPSDCRTYDQADPYLIHYPRLSYLPFLLPRLHAFFRSQLIDPDVQAHTAWFEFEDVALKWHYPVGLLYDLFSGAQPVSAEDLEAGNFREGEGLGTGEEQGQGPLPWRLTLHYTDFPTEQLVQLDGEGKVLLDAFRNSVKEADFIRNGTGKAIMSLSMTDSTALWHSVQTRVFFSSVFPFANPGSDKSSQTDNLTLFNSVNSKLLNPPGLALRHIPLKLYLPSLAPAASSSNSSLPHPSTIRVVQHLVPLQTPTRQPLTLGATLNTMLPTVFPSRRNPVLAAPAMHGAILPMNAGVEELGRAASFADGWCHILVVMLG